MSAKVIRRLTEALIGLFMLGVVINIVKAIASAVSGSFGTVRWTASTTEPVSRAMGENGSYQISHGTMAVEGQPFLGIVDLIASLAMLGVLIVALLALRKLLLNFADGQFFDERNSQLLSRIGKMLMIGVAISVAMALIIQPLMLDAIGPIEGVALHPSLSSNAADVENIWLEYSVPVMTFLLGGLALLTAEAFKRGMEYRIDSEGVL